MQVSHISTTTSSISGIELVPTFHDLLKAKSDFSVWVDFNGNEQQYKFVNGVLDTPTELSVHNLIKRTFAV